MIIHILKSPYRLTNNYLVELEGARFIGIDIGSIDISKVTSIIESKNGILVAYFLTHAHGDHSIGIKEMWDIYKMPIYCSANTVDEINNPRKNFSLYSEEIATFNYNLPCTVVIDNEHIVFGENVFKTIMVPGHSPGCITIFHEKSVFTGDFVMQDYKTPLNLPNSSRKDYKKSMEKFRLLCAHEDFTYYPGHGKSFQNLLLMH